MDADAKHDALAVRKARVALNHRVLDFGRATHGVDHAAELDDCAIARAFDDAAAVHGDGRVDQIAAKRPEARKDTVLVSAGKAAIFDDVSRQNRSKFPCFGHPRAPRTLTV